MPLTAFRQSVVVARPLGPRGLPPELEIVGSQIRWRNPDGSWGDWLDTQGPAGPNGDAQILDARSDVAGTTIEAGVTALIFNGYGGAGDQGRGARMKRLSGAPSSVESWHDQSADGAWWELELNPDGPMATTWFGLSSSNSAAVNTALLQDAFGFSDDIHGVHYHNPIGVPTNLKNITTLPTRGRLTYAMQDDETEYASSDRGTSEVVTLIFNSSYSNPGNLNGSTVNESGIAATFGPGQMVYLLKNLPGHDHALKPGTSRFSASYSAKMFWVMSDEYTNSFVGIYELYRDDSAFNAVKFNTFRRRVTLVGVGTSSFTALTTQAHNHQSDFPIKKGTLIRGKTSGALGYIVSQDANFFILEWLTDRFQVGEKVINESTGEESSDTIDSADMAETANAPMSIGLAYGQISFGGRVGLLRTQYGFHGRITCAPSSDIGSGVEQSPYFAFLFTDPASSPNTATQYKWDSITEQLIVVDGDNATSLAAIGFPGARSAYGAVGSNGILQAKSRNIGSIQDQGGGSNRWRVYLTNALRHANYYPDVQGADPRDNPRVVMSSRTTTYFDFINYDGSSTSTAALRDYVIVKVDGGNDKA